MRAAANLRLRRKLIEDCSVDVIISVGSNMFYTVTLPVTLWFLDRGKRSTQVEPIRCSSSTPAETYNQIDRAHRDWTPPASRVPRQHRPPLAQ